jgi:hypothetical protein
MARKRKIHEITVNSRCRVRVMRDVDWNQYIVQQLVNGKTIGGKDGGSFEWNRESAMSTAKLMVGELQQRVAACRDPLAGAKKRR